MYRPVYVSDGTTCTTVCRTCWKMLIYTFFNCLYALFIAFMHQCYKPGQISKKDMAAKDRYSSIFDITGMIR